mmetsp:Transcript_10541/g.24976  ORF Transcript_10541/g.24976 Transcript_10541/m.24976 type:complete len:140 (+) Transcript_10541:96-515(+)
MPSSPMSSFPFAKRFKIAILSVLVLTLVGASPVAGASSTLRNSIRDLPFASRWLEESKTEADSVIVDDPTPRSTGSFDVSVNYTVDESTRPPLKTETVTAGANLPFANCHWNLSSITTTLTMLVVNGALLQVLLLTMAL